MYYPVEDMLAILALESHRFQCSVIGEDLGTVPDEIVGILRDAGVHSYKVFFFETNEDESFINQQSTQTSLCLRYVRMTCQPYAVSGTVMT
ncbi:4-alpha-glucanotransferase [Vibrio sp. JCM 19236]|nr:4-alpha-glucanotransferase [Vibrio sp. JCM 19236]